MVVLEQLSFLFNKFDVFSLAAGVVSSQLHQVWKVLPYKPNLTWNKSTKNRPDKKSVVLVLVCIFYICRRLIGV